MRLVAVKSGGAKSAMNHHHPQQIDAHLRHADVEAAGRVRWFEEIDSTNSWLLAQRERHGQVCITEWQRAGRGRRGRTWRAAKSSSVLLSIGWRLGGVEASGLSLVSGLAIVDGLRRAGVGSAGAGLVGLKWPNDIFARGKKLGGVLTELRGGDCVIGMGINVAMPPGETWADLQSLGGNIDRDALAAALIISHCNYLRRFCHGGFAQFVDEWNDLNIHANRTVSVSAPEKTETLYGIVHGVDRQGALIIEQNGVQQRIISGEIRLAESEAEAEIRAAAVGE